MPWFKVDDNLAFHTKAVAAGNAAMGLWVRAGSWASQQLNDGFIPSHIAALLGTPQQAARLVRSGLWIEVSEGFSFHEWDERNPKREEIEAERAAGAERKRLSRARRNLTIPEEPLVNETSHTNVTRGTPTVSQRPDPTRPDPTPNNQQPTVVGARKRGTRLDPDFIPSEEARSAIISESPALDIRREHSKFLDHWAAQPGQRGVRLDWDAVWRNWMRRAADGLPRNGTNGKSRRQAETDDLFTRNAVRMGVNPDQLSLEGRPA